MLQGVADLWVVSDPITRADAAVVLGGGADLRPFVAADLYAKGLVHKILVSQVQDGAVRETWRGARAHRIQREDSPQAGRAE